MNRKSASGRMGDRGKISRLLAIAAIACLMGWVSGTDAAEDENYFEGRTLVVMVASNPGGGTDTTARLVARYWGDHVPGNPDVLIRNKPLQVLAGNDFQFRTRPDGFTVGVFAGGGSLGPVARKSKSVKYDPLKWGFIGSIERGSTVLLIRKSALPRLTDPKAEPVAVGSVSTDRPQDAMAVYGSVYAGWNIKFVLGYPSSNDMYLAYERGEIDMFGSGTTKILKRFLEGDAAALAIHEPRPDFPDVPKFEKILGDKKPSGREWKAYKAWAGPSAVDKYFAVPPKTPDAVLKTLQDSFQQTTKDPKFVQSAQNVLGEGFLVFGGEKTRELVEDALVIPEDVVGVMQGLRKKYGLPLISKLK